jgi:predicted phage terminase large subunit-like protein
VEERQKARTVIALDPAVASGPKADWAVFCVLSYIAPHFYVRRIVRGQWTQFEILARARALYEEYRPERFGIENVAAFAWLIQELHRTTRIPLRPLPPRGTDKVHRADRVRSFFEQMRVFLEEPTAENGIPRLIEEMLAFPNSDQPGWDDTVDAVVWAMLMMIVPQTRLHKTAPHRRF